MDSINRKLSTPNAIAILKEINDQGNRIATEPQLIGVSYGIDPSDLAQKLGIPIDETLYFIDRFNELDFLEYTWDDVLCGVSSKGRAYLFERGFLSSDTHINNPDLFPALNETALKKHIIKKISNTPFKEIISQISLYESNVPGSKYQLILEAPELHKGFSNIEDNWDIESPLEDDFSDIYREEPKVDYKTEWSCSVTGLAQQLQDTFVVRSDRWVLYKKTTTINKIQETTEQNETESSTQEITPVNGNNEDKKTRWPLITFLALMLSIAGFCYKVYRDNEADKLSFKNSGIQNRPHLEIVGRPSIKSIKVAPESQGKILNFNDKNLGFAPTLDTEVKLINDGSSVAKLMFEVLGDVHSGEDEIRKIILDPDKRKNIKFTFIDDFYKVVEFGKDKEHDLTLTRTILSPKDSMFTIHYLFIYSNEIGNVYDTYIWARYAQKPIKMFVADKTDKTVTLTASKDEVLKSIEFVDMRSSSYMYSKKDSEELISLLKKLQEENKNTEHTEETGSSKKETSL